MKKNKASPNLKNGFVRLPNELLEALMRLNLSPLESRIFWVVIRETLGWAKKEKRISGKRFSELTGISRSHVCDILKKLQKRRIVVRTKNKVGLQENYLRWKGLKKLPKRPLPKQATSPKLFLKQGTTQGSLNKEQMFLKQGTNVPQTGNKKTELANVYKGNSPPKDIIKDIIKDKERAAAKILLIFRGKTTPKKILKAIKDKDPDEMIALAKDCQEKEEKGLTKNAPGLFFKQAKKITRAPGTETKPKENNETEQEFETRRRKDIEALKKKRGTGPRQEPFYKQLEKLKQPKVAK